MVAKPFDSCRRSFGGDSKMLVLACSFCIFGGESKISVFISRMFVGVGGGVVISNADSDSCFFSELKGILFLLKVNIKRLAFILTD